MRDTQQKFSLKNIVINSQQEHEEEANRMEALKDALVNSKLKFLAKAIIHSQPRNLPFSYFSNRRFELIFY